MYYEGDSKGRYVPVAVPGHTPPASVLNAPGVISPTTKNGAKGEDTLATRLAIAAFRRMHQRITLINYPHFDWPLGHVYGGMLDRPRVAEVMKGFDHDLGLIEDAYRKAGVLDRTLFVITSDHGMMPIRHYVPESLIDSAIQRAGTTAPDIAADSAEYVWLADPSKAKTVATIVAGAHNREVQSAYYLTERNGAPTYVRASASKLSGADESANQMLLRAMINGHEPDVVVFAANGATFTSPDSHWKGDHGGNQWASQHIPLVLSGPGIRSGVVSHDPVQLEDVAPTVLADLGVRPTGMSGHVLTEALISPSSARLKARRAEVRGIAPMVRALKSAN